MKNRAKTAGLVVLTALLILSGVVIYRLWTEGGAHRQELEYSYTRSLGSLTEYLADLDNTLQKASYVSTATGQAGIAAKLQEAGGGAKSAIEGLPFSEDKGEKIERSLSVLSDFGLYLGRKSAEGLALSPEDYAVIDTLTKHVGAISAAFSAIRQSAADGSLSIGETEAFFTNTLSLPEAPGFDDGLSDVATEISALPTMLYDGPFSDHIEQREPEFLKGKAEISREGAIEKAARFLKIEPGSLEITFETEGPLAAYEISGEDQTIKITKIGGEVSFYKRNIDAADTKLTYEEARDIALKLLEEAGFSNMKESYFVTHDNICTINFAATQEDVVLYPDLIKVSIELDEGTMVEFTSTGYLMNHREREELIPALTEERASQSVSKSLQITGIATAVIPTPGDGERLSYEFTCEDGENQQVLVYINGTTGLEEQIYLVTKSDGGFLVR